MAVRFSASGQSYSSTSGVPTTRLFTVTCWVYFTVFHTATTDVVWSFSSYAGGETSLFYSDEGNLTFDWPPGGATRLDPGTVTTATWRKLAVTVNGDDVTAYVGTATSGLTSYTTSQNYALPSGALTLDIGDALAPSSSFLDGRIAAFKMWDAALTPAELNLEFRSYRPNRIAGLNRWHPFTKAETTDFSGHGRTLAGGSGATTENGPPIRWASVQSIVTPWDPTTVVWYAHYDTTSGELLSLGTVAPSPLPSGTAVLELLNQPNQSTHEWSTTARAFVPREGVTVVDRVDDLVADASLASVWSTLDATQKQALKDRMGQMLSSQRHRQTFQNPDLD